MATSLQTLTQRTQGFEAFVLRNDAVEMSAVPELGAKVVSLKNLRTGREWMWAPDNSRRLFSNSIHDRFEQSTLVGWDECLPTIAPCRWTGRELPDHGEVWSVPWHVEASGAGSITTRVQLPISPFVFTRALEIEGSTVVARYSLTNTNRATERFIWAMHPLLTIEEGDQLELPEEARSALVGDRWVSSLAFDSAPACAKRFVRFANLSATTRERPVPPHPHPLPRGEGVALCRASAMPSASTGQETGSDLSLSLGERVGARGTSASEFSNKPASFPGLIRAGLFNSRTGDRITFEWSSAENDTLGLWLTRGGWHGHHHLAIEPTNASHDSLAVAAGDLNHSGSIAAGQTFSWTVRIHLTP